MPVTIHPIFAKNVGTSFTTVYTAPSTGATVLRLYLTNTTSQTVYGNIAYLNPLNGTTVYQIKNIFLPASYTFEVKPFQPLEEDGLIKISSSLASSLDVTGSVMPVKKFMPLLVQGIGMATTDLYTAPAGGASLLRAYLANITNATVLANISYFDSSGSIQPYQVKDVLVPVGNTFAIEPVQRLDAGDIVRISASADNSLDLTGCIME